MSNTRKTVRRNNSTRKNKSKKKYGGNNNMDFMNAIKNANLEYVKQNIATINGLSYEDAYGNTPLDNAINGYNSIEHQIPDEEQFNRFSNYVEIIRLLLENGANGENIGLPNFNFENINLENANLKNASLRGSNMYNANLEGAELQNADLSKVDLTNATLELTNLTNTNFTGANLDNTNFDNAVIDGTVFTNTILDDDDEYHEEEDEEDDEEDDEYDEEETPVLPELEFIPRSPEGPPTDYSPPRGNNNQSLLDLIDSYHENNPQVNNGNRSRPRLILSELETEDRKERLLRERNEKKQKYLERPKVTLNMNETNPFENVGLTGYNAITMEDIDYCDYIKESNDNVIFIYNQQVGLLDKQKIRTLIETETLDETKVVYECKELSVAFVPHEENIISGPMLNMRILAIYGLTVPLNELDAVVNGEHQIFVIETINDKKTIPIASLSTRVATGNESGYAVVSADHCQSEVYIQIGKLSYVENNVLFDECTKKGGKKGKIKRKKQTHKKTTKSKTTKRKTIKK